MKKRKKLTARQMLTLEKHSEHHTKKHMDFMKKEMLNGSTFTAAHKKAQKEYYHFQRRAWIP